MSNDALMSVKRVKDVSLDSALEKINKFVAKTEHDEKFAPEEIVEKLKIIRDSLGEYKSCVDKVAPLSKKRKLSSGFILEADGNSDDDIIVPKVEVEKKSSKKKKHKKEKC